MNLTGYVQCILSVDSLVDIFIASGWEVFRDLAFWLMYWLYCFSSGLSVSLHIVVWIKITIKCGVMTVGRGASLMCYRYVVNEDIDSA